MSDDSDDNRMRKNSSGPPDYQAEVLLACASLTSLTEDTLPRRNEIRFEPRPAGVDRIARCDDNDDAIRNLCPEWVREIAAMSAPLAVLYLFVRSHRLAADALVTLVWSDAKHGYMMVLRQ